MVVSRCTSCRNRKKVTPMYRSNKARMFKRAGASAALTIGAVAGVAAVAGASTHHPSAKTPSSRSHVDGWGTPPRGAFAGGLVTVLTSSSITVQNPTGTLTYAIGSGTTVTKDDVASSFADLAVGQHVDIVVSSTSATTATKIDIDTRAPARGPGSGGIVTALSGTSITVKDRSGSSSTFTIDASTKVTKERSSASVSDLALGELVMISPSTSSTTTAASIDVELAHVAGRVTAVSGDSITLSDRDGATKTVVVNSATVISKNAASATLGDVTVGSFVFAEGTFDAAATTLSASTLGIGAPGAGSGPQGFGPGDAGHGPGGPGQGPGAF